MGDDSIRELAEQFLEMMDEAVEKGVEPRHVLMALDDARREWMLENMEKIVTAPPADTR